MAVGCSEDAEVRPPLAQDCNDPACVAARGNAVLGGVGAIAPGGNGGGAGGGPGMPGAGIVLAGNVRQVTQLDPPLSQAVPVVLEVRAPSAVDGADAIADQTDAAGAYRLEDVAQAANVWVGVGTFEEPLTDTFYMDTLQAVDPTGSPDDLVVMPRSTMQELAASAFSIDPIELDPAGAHLVVRFVDPSGTALPEVVVINPPVSNATRIAYDSGVNAYSEVSEATGVRGVAVIVNYPTVRYPGAGLQLIATLNDEDYVVDVQVAADSVSVVTAVIDPR